MSYDTASGDRLGILMAVFPPDAVRWMKNIPRQLLLHCSTSCIHAVVYFKFRAALDVQVVASSFEQLWMSKSLLAF